MRIGLICLLFFSTLLNIPVSTKRKESCVKFLDSVKKNGTLLLYSHDIEHGSLPERKFIRDVDVAPSGIFFYDENTCDFLDLKKMGTRKSMRLADIIWVDSPFFYRYFFPTIENRNKPYKLKKQQAVNHHFHESFMGHKHLFNLVLKNWSMVHNDAEFPDFMPETYSLFRPAERERFLERVQESRRNEVWILKNAVVNEGAGLNILNQTEMIEFVSFLHDLDNKTSSFEYKDSIDGKDQIVIQRYITNPLLLEGKKVSWRVLFFIASIEPLQIFLWKYNKNGFVLSATYPYKNSDFKDARIHFTNYGLQERLAPELHHRSLKFFEVVDQMVKENIIKESEKDTWLEEIFFPQVKNILSVVGKALKLEMKSGTFSRAREFYTDDFGTYFGQYGLDLVVDQNFHVWVTELQAGVFVPYQKEHMRVRVAPMYQEMVEIINEIRNHKIQGDGSKLLEYRSVKHFELVDVESSENCDESEEL